MDCIAIMEVPLQARSDVLVYTSAQVGRLRFFTSLPVGQLIDIVLRRRTHSLPGLLD
ncbi:hypothetical protein PAXRUDRAFT_835387 [Paxillus rubicundulus Ve08.2h10]|uniref:Uncharacterized protein n=1 Tax=Paxillus rubicundulus Ve08.2h10 TaxID=930991 RepID=A0A0D0BZ60_9AGAM|nr:hypothetical protein PAXRUDRAFT_835387 [Paxillus rubicundulus Ve08.2h10]